MGKGGNRWRTAAGVAALLAFLFALWTWNSLLREVNGTVQQMRANGSGQTFRTEWVSPEGMSHWTETEQLPGEPLVDWLARHRAAEAALKEIYAQ
jgi:hypothetical protein